MMASRLRASTLLSLLIACVLAILILPAAAFDEPAADQLQAIPPLTGPVVDLTGTLTPQQTEQLSQKLRSLHARYGAQMQVLMVPTTQPEDAFSYSLRVVEKWQLGSKEKDDGLLLLIAKNDRRTQIQTGYGLEGVIPDIVAKSLLRDTLSPFLKQGDFAGGINAVIDASFQRISGEVTAMPEQQPQRHVRGQQPSWLGPVIFGAIIISILSNIMGGFLASGFGAVGVFLFVWLILGTSLVLAILLALASPLLALAFRHGGGYYGGGGFGGGGFGGGGSWSGGGGGFGGGGASGDW